MNRFKGFLLHTGVTCSVACIAAKILDWYNPYMDFTGHIWFLQLTLYITVILLAFAGVFGKKKTLALSGRMSGKTGGERCRK